MAGKRTTTPLSESLSEAVQAVSRALADLPTPGMLIGGIAVIAPARHSIAWLPFELEALAASETLALAGVQVRVARAEDLVIYKAVAWRPQDQQDIERLLTTHGTRVDLTRIRRVVGEFAAALDEPERLKELEALIERIRA